MVRNKGNEDTDDTKQEMEQPKVELVTENQLLNFKLDRLYDLCSEIYSKLDK